HIRCNSAVNYPYCIEQLLLCIICKYLLKKKLLKCLCNVYTFFLARFNSIQNCITQMFNRNFFL
uniref:Uncharacterized protein n=1 Tax=Dromaius novaehollandiae TaxID=8790 RepID=A0A8C4JAV8_DRONO